MVKSPDGDKDGQTYAMMYYLLDEKNRQHINYIGMQSSDSSLLCNDGYFVQIVPNKFPNYYWPTCIWAYPPNPPPSKSEEILIFPAQMNVYGGGSSPQISYKYDVATDTWEKHYNIYDHLGTLQQTYKEEGSGIIPTSMQTHMAFGGERWTNKNLTETESTLLNWIGKEKDNESKLGDHGVRKYEYETGRFISIDPLWAKYYGWSPYQYSMNSPVMLVDVGGENAVAVIDKQNQSIIMKATYVVSNVSYSQEEAITIKKDVNELLNSQNYSISKGQYEGYSVKFELDFVYPSNGEYISPENFNYEGVNIGNTFYVGRESDFKEKNIIDANGIRKGIVAGKTQDHRNIAMNPSKDNLINRLHEFFHTFFYDNDAAPSGIGKYGKPQLPNQKDIDNVIYNEQLPKKIK